jgi:hypothetical protein
MKSTPVRFDAPFWVLLLGGVILVGSFGCIGLAAAAQDAARADACLVRVVTL